MNQNYPLASRHLLKTLAVFVLSGLLWPAAAMAQTYQLPATGSTTITTCSGTLYDNGGPTGTYLANSNSSVTIMPATAGNHVRLQFNTIAVETGYDYLYVYDGTSTSAPLIGTYNSSYQPGTLYGTTASGALTVRLSSDNVVQYDGFEATIGCVATVPPQAQPDLTVQGAQLYPTSVVAGGTLNTSCSVYNLSGATASSSNVGYYLSTNAVLDASDVLLGNSTGYAIGVGQYSSQYATVTVPVGTVSGAYYLLYAADYQNQVAESNENNNVSAVSFNVIASTVDLVTAQASVSPTNPAPGTPLYMSCYINNLGNAAAASSSVGFYLSTDATLDAADQLLTSQYGAQLYPNYPSQRSGTAAIPSNLAPGTYYILFVADYQNQVPESNETNNVTAVSFTVTPPGVDLVIQQAQLYPTSTVAGNSIQTSCLIVNQGNVTASSSTVGFYLSTNTVFDASDVLLNTAVGYTLNGGQSSSRYAYPIIPANTAAGSYFVLYVADPANAVAETNETNNVASLALTVQAPTYDLYISSTYLSPNSVAPGGSTQASCYLYNQGNALASPATIGFYLSTNAVLDASDVLIGNSTGTVSGQSSSSRYATLTVPTGTAAGSYYVLFVADYLNQLAETNENNNISTATLQVVAPGIDLTITQAYLSVTSTAPGNSVSTSSYIQNLGNTTSPSSTIGYYLSTNTVFDASDVLLYTSVGSSLAAYQYYSRYDNVTIPTGTAPGSYYVLFVADPANAVAETNENNNVASAALQIVAPGIDLTITQAYLSATSTAAGSSVSASCYIQNLGNSISPSSTIGYYLSTNTVLDASDVLLLTAPGTSLAAYQYSSRYNNVTIPTGTLSGNYYILFVADPANAVAETNENNNVASAAIQVVAPGIDLTIVQPYLSASTSAAGNSISTSSYIQNLGNTTSPSSTLGYYLSTNTVFDASDVLLYTSPGGSLVAYQYSSRYDNITIPAGTAAGSYYVLFVADPANVVAETNETNNVASVPLLLLAPGVDLQIQQPQLGGTSVTPGFTIAGACSIVNAGTSTASSSTVGYYLSTNTVFDASDVLLSTVTGTALPAGQSSYRNATLTIPTGTTAGSYYVLFVADPANAVAETNETNNVASLALTVNGPFTGTLVPFSGTATVTTCSTTIYDNGGYSNYADNSNGSLTILPGTAGSMVQLLFTSFATEGGYDYVSIYNGTTATAATLLGSYTGTQGPNLPFTATNSAGALTVVFTSDGSITASGFEAAVSCVAAPQADLLLTQIGASPSTVPAGNNVSMSAIIANQGGGNASSSAVGYYLSTNAVLDASDVLLGTSAGGALGVNLDETRQLVTAIPTNTTPGAYFLLFVADPQNVVSESNETNNLASLAFTVTQGTATRNQTAGYTVDVLPNPVVAGSALRVQLSGNGPGGAVEATLYNALGQRVQIQPLRLNAGRATVAELPTQGLATGVYTLRLTGAGLNVTRRVVVE
ncbi:MAG: T9SS type A sorting domain-containing protein [Bacteroidota bacterium]|nr:T9SS type A sorting domain-containing protein [Bacteroidota bacterium]